MLSSKKYEHKVLSAVSISRVLASTYRDKAFYFM